MLPLSAAALLRKPTDPGFFFRFEATTPTPASPPSAPSSLALRVQPRPCRQFWIDSPFVIVQDDLGTSLCDTGTRWIAFGYALAGLDPDFTSPTDRNESRSLKRIVQNLVSTNVMCAGLGSTGGPSLNVLDETA